MDQPDQENSEELKELLEKDIELNKENNEMLKSMARTARWSLIFTIIKWVIIIGGVFGIYYYFGQIFNAIYGRYTELLGLPGGSAQTATSSSFIQVKIDELRNAVRGL